MQRTLFLAALLGGAVPAYAGGHHHPLSFAVIGDTPYGTSPSDTSEFDASPAFIDAIDADPAVSYVVHVGDIHSGKQDCTEAYDRSIFELWQRFTVPLVYTPGDNEWTDCHKKAEGGGVLDANGDDVDYAGGDPLANLDLVRQIFFAHPALALGGGFMPLASQSWFYDRRHPDDADFVENVIWEQHDVVFVTIDLPGGSNNDEDVWFGAATESQAQADERDARTGADRRWLDAAFQLARVTHAKAVVIAAQADMWDPEKCAAHQTGYEPIVKTIADDSLGFGKPVLMFNGDSHVYQSSNPFTPDNDIHPGYDVPNFHRIVVHGSTMPLEYLRVTIDPDGDAGADDEDFGPFRWTRIVPASE